MRDLLGQGWEIVPAGGATGEAFFASHQEKKLFLKRNSSPFLAVLSAEGIVPKLVWTRRLENGDVITAQQCLDGRELEPEEMGQEQTARLLHKIHTSKPLLSMLERLGKKPFTPKRILDRVGRKLDERLLSQKLIRNSIEKLRELVQEIDYADFAVCHGDINHNNWLLTDKEELYLIDWDSAMIADPALDFGALLHTYVPKEDWEAWLQKYGVALTPDLEMRMNWHVIAQTLLSIQWHYEKDRLQEMDRLQDFLKTLL